MEPNNQTVQQAVVVSQVEMRYGQTSSRIALFSEDGSVLSVSNKDVLPVNVADTMFGLSGISDNTGSILSALSYASSKGRNLYFSKRPFNQPYVIGGTGILLELPAGVNISADQGVVLKVKDGNGNYKSMVGATSPTDLSGLTIDGLTFDQNSSGNAVSDVATLLVEGTQRFCVFVGTGSDICVRNSKFKNIDGLNTIYIGSSTMKDVRIQNNDFSLVGTSPAWHDHSTIYTSCDGSTILGNTFRGILGSNGATTAIETHGPNQNVSHNRVDSYKIGANITGITNLGNDGILVEDNNFRNVLIGVQLWSWKPTSGTTTGLKDVTVKNNYILIDRDPWSISSSDFPHGVCFSQSAPGGRTLDHVEGLTISENMIRFKTATVVTTNDHQNASGLELVSQDSLVEFRNLEISKNRVIGALGPALRIGAKLRIAEICDNLWIDPSSTGEGSPPAPWRSAICMTGNADLADVNLYHNKTFDTRGTHLLVQGWLTSLSGGNTSVRSEEWDNPVVCSDGVIIPENSQTSGKRLSARGVPIGRRLKSGLYHTSEGGTPTTLALTAAQEYAIPFQIGSQQSFTEIAANITVIGTTGALLRYGLRADDGSGGPGTLIADFGTTTAETLASRPITISQTFPAGRLWLTVTAQVAGCTVTAISGWLVGSSGASSVAGAIGGRSAQYQTGVTGALPGSFTSGGQTPNCPAIFVKAA